MIAAPKIVHTGPPAVRAAAAIYDEAVERYHGAIEASRVAERELREAQDKRRREVHSAAKKGTALPSSAALVKADEKAAAARERMQECERIAVGRSRALAAAVAEHAAEWRHDAGSLITAAVEQHAEAAGGYLATVHAVGDALALEAWLLQCEERAVAGSISGTLRPFPTIESVLAQRNPVGAVELLLAWLAEGHTEPVRPPGGRAEVVDVEPDAPAA